MYHGDLDLCVRDQDLGLRGQDLNLGGQDLGLGSGFQGPGSSSHVPVSWSYKQLQSNILIQNLDQKIRIWISKAKLCVSKPKIWTHLLIYGSLRQESGQNGL